MELPEAMRTLLIDTAVSLRGASRRRFMAQTDPTFQTTRRFCRLSAAEVRQQGQRAGGMGD